MGAIFNDGNFDWLFTITHPKIGEISSPVILDPIDVSLLKARSLTTMMGVLMSVLSWSLLSVVLAIVNFLKYRSCYVKGKGFNFI